MNSSSNSKKEVMNGGGKYRMVTLTQTACKIYTLILAERLKKEMERKAILPPNQTGFRKGMGQHLRTELFNQ